MSSQQIQECSQCLLNTKDTSYISFDDNGVCSYCQSYKHKVFSLGSANEKSDYLKTKINEIKLHGKGKKFDCLLGLSGGVDSSYMAFLAHELGLKPLVIHLDNGWNSEIAVKNIEKICEKFGFELYTYVIDWEEFVGLQKAYLKAGVVDIEVLTDHAIYAILNKLSYKFKIKYTLSGFNYETEAIMPKGWTYSKRDFLNIKDIVAKYGEEVKFKTYPYINFYKALFYYWFLKLETFELLNFVEYDKETAKKTLISEIGWTDYGGKHYESVFTKFYQSYILPVKFGIDKRRAHLSNQICAQKISKKQANQILETKPFDEQLISMERDYILKKFSLSEKEFEKIMQEKPRPHSEFDTDQRLWNRYFSLINKIKFWKKRY
ncbi:MAG: N-acetyl sugar amidotransferase [Bacteroidota bacterium]|nr:N-acetyl sugar amidotransferase [Bacteroidota bacterium]